MKKNWIPELMYEENEQGVSEMLPFILVPKDEVMPKFLLIWENKDTGEIEPGPNGEEMPVVESQLCQYGHMGILKEKLSAEDYDKVRIALGLEPMKVAVEKGKVISANVSQTIGAQSKSK